MIGGVTMDNQVNGQTSTMIDIFCEGGDEFVRASDGREEEIEGRVFFRKMDTVEMKSIKWRR